MRSLPCAVSAAWDLPERGTLTADQIQAVRDAVAACQRCPIFHACRESATTNPPAYRCVQGGLIFDRAKGSRHGMDVDRWVSRLTAVAAPRPTREITADGQPCEQCGSAMPISLCGRRYCSTACKVRARNGRRTIQPGDPCDTCGERMPATPAERVRHAAAHNSEVMRVQAAQRARLAVQLRDEGKSRAEIARHLRVHPDTVKRWLRTAAA